MERVLFEASIEGNVTSFLGLLDSDPLILDRILVKCYSETPLHVAAMLGHGDLVKEILARKPELARELDSQRLSPLHLASAKGYVGIVKALVSVNSEMCLARDRDGRNPLHLATIKGHVDVLKELVHARPHVARVTTDRGETILHLCVIHNQLELFKLLVGTIGDFEFVNSKDDDGNTILHLAVAYKQLETITFLLVSTKIEVNAVNASGFTAMDIVAQSRRDVKDMDIVESLRVVGALRAKDNPSLVGHKLDISLQNPRIYQQKHKKSRKKCLNKKDDWLEKKRNTLIVVASLIATMAFQAGLNPPGGVWQDDIIDSQDDMVSQPHKAGSSIMAHNHPGAYIQFLHYNTVGFIASLSIILLLISGLPLRPRFFMWVLMMIMWVAVSAMSMTYLLSCLVFTPADISTYGLLICTVWVWLGLMAFLMLGHTIRLTLKMIRKLRRVAMRRWRPIKKHTIF